MQRLSFEMALTFGNTFTNMLMLCVYIIVVINEEGKKMLIFHNVLEETGNIVQMQGGR